MKKYVLAPYITIFPANNKFFVNRGSLQDVLDYSPVSQGLVELSDFCLQPRTENEINNYIKAEKIDPSVYQYLINKNMLIDAEFDCTNPDSRNELFYNYVSGDYKSYSAKIKNSHIALVGAGGIGNFMATSLSSLHVRKLTIIDFDVVETHNLNRQFLFDLDDIGRIKSQVIKEKILRRNNEIEIDLLHGEVTKKLLDKLISDDNNRPDVVILSADAYYCVSLLNQFCIKNELPLLNVGYMNDISVIGPFYIPNYTCCLQCENISLLWEDNNSSIHPSLKEKIDRINGNEISPSFFTNNAIASCMAVIDIMHYLNGDLDKINAANKRIGIVNSKFQVLEVPVQRNKHCKYCGEEKTL